MSNQSNIIITSELVDAYIICPVKPFLIVGNVQKSRSEYQQLELRICSEYNKSAKREIESHEEDIYPRHGKLLTEEDLQKGYSFFFDTSMAIDNYSSSCNGLIKAKGKSTFGDFHYEPLLFLRYSGVNNVIKLSLAFQVYVLSKIQNFTPHNATVIQSQSHKKKRINLAQSNISIREIIKDLKKCLQSNDIPQIHLNSNCAFCEFEQYCRKMAKEADHLSLLRGITSKEVFRHNKNGIFTVTQLSYTFRPRRRPKRAKPATPPHSFPLKALALREKQVYIHGKPILPAAQTRIYLDVEGIPGKQFDYLIGILVDNDSDNLDFRYFWAESEKDQRTIYKKILDTLKSYKKSKIYHFGTYENQMVKRMMRSLSDDYADEISNIKKKFVNVLTLIYSHIYFPTYSNSLKEIAKFLGYQWYDKRIDGLQSIVLRDRWERTSNDKIKKSLINYNRDDCFALKLVVDYLNIHLSPDALSNKQNKKGDRCNIVNTKELYAQTKTHRFGKAKFSSPELGFVNKCAYFDYQREKVYARTNKLLRKITSRNIRKNKKIKPNRKVEINVKKCMHCNSRKIIERVKLHKITIDLKFFAGGAKKWISEYHSWRYFCRKCKKTFQPVDFPADRFTYGEGLIAWCIYFNVIGGQSLSKVKDSLFDVFSITVSQPTVQRFKARLVEQLSGMAEEIQDELMKSSMLHVDETEVKLRKTKGYVWVFCNMDTVLFQYRESRKANFLGDMLLEFQGVLISDFFTGYDSLPCPQQKCLIHLIRDMNEDLRKNPFDHEFKELLNNFAKLIQEIVKTIDKFGLKKRNLNKHRITVSKFFKFVTDKQYSHDVSKKYQKRFEKYGARLFTFLDYDGVPWNNNNVEHAIKAFAKYRRFADGRLTEKSINDYLVLLSVFQTCEYRNIDVLQFLLSKNRKLC